MNTGFWADTVNAESGWECLHNIMPSERGRESDLSLMDYLHGYCIQFSKALHDVLGYPMYGIWEHDGEEDTFVHAFCELPNGDVVDVRGVTERWDAFLDEFDDMIFDRSDVDVQPLDYFPGDTSDQYVAIAREIIEAYPNYYR